MTEMEFAERLKALRKANNLTQQELADLLGVSNKSVSRWETGGYPDVAMLGPLAKALGVTVDDLLGEVPPLRSLERADWQNLLSYAFAIGGGILFFLLNLFTPTLVCYLLYLGALAYGVYLQRHYTYHSRWFYTSSLIMNFFVNFRLVTPLVALFSSSLSSLIGSSASISDMVLGFVIRAYFPCIVLAFVLTLITRAVIRREGSGELPRLSLPRLRKAAISPAKLLPVLIPILTSCFWLLYTLDSHKTYAIFPKWFYTAQYPLFYGLALLLTVLGVVWLLIKKQRWMLIPMLLMSWGCAALFPSAVRRTMAYSLNSGAIFTYNGALSSRAYAKFSTPTVALFITAVVLVGLYILCCFIRFEKKRA